MQIKPECICEINHSSPYQSYAEPPSNEEVLVPAKWWQFTWRHSNIPISDSSLTSSKGPILPLGRLGTRKHCCMHTQRMPGCRIIQVSFLHAHQAAAWLQLLIFRGSYTISRIHAQLDKWCSLWCGGVSSNSPLMTKSFIFFFRVEQTLHASRKSGACWDFSYQYKHDTLLYTIMPYAHHIIVDTGAVAQTNYEWFILLSTA